MGVRTVVGIVLALAFGGFVIVVWRRKTKPEQWHEQPCRRYQPELDEVE